MEEIGSETTAIAPSTSSSRNVEQEQTRTYSEAIGNSLPSDAITNLHDYLRDARVHKPYESHAEVRFIYETLDKEGWNTRVKDLVDLWVEDASNIQRAAVRVGRKPEQGKKLLRGYCAFRLKVFDGEEWTSPLDSLGMDVHEPQVVVFVALEDLNSSNGFFMELKKGHDVCLDSRAKLRFPRTGNGIGIFIALNL